MDRRPAFGCPFERTRRFRQSVSRCANEIQPERQVVNKGGRSSRSICVVTDYGGFDFTTVAIELANQLSIPVYSDVDRDSCPYTQALIVIPYHLEKISSYAIAIHDLCNDSKRCRNKRLKNKTKSQPFFVDFCPPINSRLGKRFEGHSGTDLLLKAVSPRDQIVYDLTAGFGQDSVLMLHGGASHVVMVERDPVVAALLFDALRRVHLIASDGDPMDSHTQRAVDLSKRLTMEETSDAIHVAKAVVSDTSAQRPDVCYVDPMFPARRKSAAVKKNMQILHGLLSSQANEQAASTNEQELNLLEAAWNLATRRVVVKRPINADCVGGTLPNGLKPSYEIKGSINRWDIYVK
jgi:16S rRNA (guanine1516-N2)-methyltransferase